MKTWTLSGQNTKVFFIAAQAYTNTATRMEYLMRAMRTSFQMAISYSDAPMASSRNMNSRK